jgi:5,10-methylenetetrahydromethanopterin reductase
MKLSLASFGAESSAEFLEQVELAELLGFHAFVHDDKQWTRELFSRLGAATQVTTKLGLGAGGLDPWLRHAALLAQATATLAEMAPGRFRVIMGTRGHFKTLPGYGHQPGIPALRESAELMRQLWHGERLALDGEVVKFDGALDWKPSAIPSLSIAARDPEALALAGAVADGVMIENLASQTGLQHAKEHIGAGLDASQRDWSDLRVAVWTPVCLLEHTESPVPARLTREVARAFWSDRLTLGPMVDRLAADATPAFRKLVREAPAELPPSTVERLCELMPRGITDSLALVGTAAQVVDRLKALHAEGVEEVVLSPIPVSEQDSVDFIYKLAQHVLPHFSGRAARAV